MNKSIKESYSKVKLDDISKQELYSHIIKSSQDSQTKKQKKRLTPVIILACSFLFIAMVMPMMRMGSSSLNSPEEKTSPSIPSTLSQLPSEISPEYAREQGFYVNVHEKIYNKEVLEDFLEKVEKKISASIIIVQYTDEGDPIVKEINYENDFEIYHDATRDMYGSKGVTKYSYQFIGYYEDHLYAYNDQLNQQTIDNGECFFIN